MNGDVEKEGYHGVSRIEFAKRLKALRDVVSREAYEAHLVPLIPADQRDAVEKSMGGLTQEDEFAVMSRLMGTAKALIPLEQAPILGGKPGVPDYLACFTVTDLNNEQRQKTDETYRCFVEIKSTTRESYSLSGGALQRLRALSSGFSVPLVIAVRFVQYPTHPVWVIVEDPGTEGKISIELANLITGARSRIWNDVIYWIKPDISIEMYYSSSYRYSGVNHATHGNLGKLVVRDRDREWYIDDDSVGHVAMCLKALHLRDMPDQSSSDGTTYRHVSVPQSRFATMVDLLYQINNLALGENGVSIYNPPLLIARSDRSSGSELITRSEVEVILKSLVDIGMITILTYDEFLSQHREMVIPTKGQ